MRNCLLNDAVSIPKFEGSKVLAKNWVRDLDGSVTWDGLLSWRFTYCRWETSFCIEFNRNSLEVGFCVAVSNRPEVNGNFIAEFSSVFAAGPALIHDCMIEGKRGIYGTSGGMKNIAFINNHFRSVSDSLTNAFFGFKNIPDILRTVQVKNNIFDGTAVSKPLYSSTIADANVQTANNTLINVPTGAANSPTGDPIGPARQSKISAWHQRALSQRQLGKKNCLERINRDLVKRYRRSCASKAGASSRCPLECRIVSNYGSRGRPV